MRRYERLEIPPQWSSKEDRLAALAQMGKGRTKESPVGSVTVEEGGRLQMNPDRSCPDSPRVREYASVAETEGFRPTSLEQGRQILIRYERFLPVRIHVASTLRANLKESQRVKKRGWNRRALAFGSSHLRLQLPMLLNSRKGS